MDLDVAVAVTVDVAMDVDKNGVVEVGGCGQ
jgi:hypothetical protein